MVDSISTRGPRVTPQDIATIAEPFGLTAFQLKNISDAVTKAPDLPEQVRTLKSWGPAAEGFVSAVDAYFQGLILPASTSPGTADRQAERRFLTIEPGTATEPFRHLDVDGSHQGGWKWAQRTVEPGADIKRASQRAQKLWAHIENSGDYERAELREDGGRHEITYVYRDKAKRLGAYSARQVTEVFDGQGNMAAIEIPGMSRLSSLPRDVSDCVLQQMHPKTSYLRVTRAPDGGYLVQCNNLTQGPQRFTFAFDAEGKRLP